MTFKAIAEFAACWTGSKTAFALAPISMYWWHRDAVPLMLLVLLQNTANRHSRALHLKLDELITKLPQPDSSKARIEKELD
jgi:low affinity Fe/Cu permease